MTTSANGIHVAFLRNLNLGHPGSPVAAALVAAFGGPERAWSVQTNGTVLLRTDDPDATVATARRRLQRDGFEHDVVCRSVAEVVALQASCPRPSAEDEVYRVMLSLFDRDGPAVPPPAGLALVEVVELGSGHAWSLCRRRGRTVGDVTGAVERATGVVATTRSAGTIERLLVRAARLGDPAG